MKQALAILLGLLALALVLLCGCAALLTLALWEFLTCLLQLAIES